MALPSNRSSSPSMAAGRTSPNSRNSEIGNSVRRSFSGNPFSKPSIVANPRSLMNPATPANSPSDYPRRNLFTSRDNEEKENGKDQSPLSVRVRSPTVGKSTKHFMSPTISAASKIAVSPKKKILGDRNEPVRSSFSFSGMKSSSLNLANQNPEASMAVDSNTNPKIAPIANSKMVTMAVEIGIEAEIAPISDTSIVAAPSKAPKTVRFGGFEVISDMYDANSENVTMATEADTKPEIAPISNFAIDAAAPEAASKTMRFSGFEVISDSNNELESPAKSNFTEEVDCVNLDPSFKISPDSSPMVVAPLDADPLLITPYDPKTNYLMPRPQFLHYRPNRRINQYEPDGKLDELFSESEFIEESDEASSNESQMEEEEEEEEEIVDVSEQTPIEAKKSYKQYFYRIFKISSLLLILLTAACFSIHVHDPDLLERGASLLTVEDPSEIYKFARTNFDVLVGKLEVWQENSISFISDVVSNLRSGPPLIYLNQTDFFYNDVSADGQCLVLSHQNLNVVEEAMNAREFDIAEEPVEIGGQNEEVEQEQESLQEIEAMEKEIDVKPVERESQNEDELFQEIEAIANHPKDSEEDENKEGGEELLRETEDAKQGEIEIEPVERESQNEEELEEGSLQESFQEFIEENDEAEESFQEFIEVSSSNSASDPKASEEDDIQEKQTEENCEVSSSPGFNFPDQVEQEYATTGETGEEEQNESMQRSKAELQYQLLPVSPPSEPRLDVEEENSGKINLDHEISRDYFKQNTAVIVISSAILLGLSLVVIPAGLIYARKSTSKPPSMAAITEEQVEQQQQPLLKDQGKTNQSPVEEEEEAAMDDDDENMAAGEFSSSETSSFHYSRMRETDVMKKSNGVESSHGRKKKKNSRRESMASSSLDEYSVSTSSASPSYGSFTTYEKIPIKHVNGEEEIMTPVRRSSRIKKQHN